MREATAAKRHPGIQVHEATAAKLHPGIKVREANTAKRHPGIRVREATAAKRHPGVPEGASPKGHPRRGDNGIGIGNGNGMAWLDIAWHGLTSHGMA